MKGHPRKGPATGKNRQKDFRIAFTTLGGIGCALDYKNSAFNDETIATLKYMQSLVRVKGDMTEKRVNVMIAFQASKLAEQRSFEQEIRGLLSTKKYPWSPYRGVKGAPFTQYGAFISRRKVKEFSNGANKY